MEARKSSAWFSVLRNKSFVRFWLRLAQMGNSEEIYRSKFVAFHRDRKHRRGTRLWEKLLVISLQITSDLFVG